MATDRARSPSAWLLVIALVVLSLSPMMTRSQCTRDMSAMLARLMADGELKPTGYESYTPEETAWLITFHAFDAAVIPTGDVVAALGFGLVIFLVAIAVFIATGRDARGVRQLPNRVGPGGPVAPRDI